MHEVCIIFYSKSRLALTPSRPSIDSHVSRLSEFRPSQPFHQPQTRQ